MFSVNRSYSYDQHGNVLRTFVQLQVNEPLTLIPATFEKDLSALSDAEVEKLALDDFYNRVFPNRAENEQFQLLKQTNKEQNETIKQAEGVMRELSRMSYENRDELDLIHHQLTVLAEKAKVTLPTELPEEGDGEHVEAHEDDAN